MNKMSAAESDTRADATERWRAARRFIRPTKRVVGDLLSWQGGSSTSLQVVGLQDGDTITLLHLSFTQYRVRLAGIDAPEKGQAFGHVPPASPLDALLWKARDCELRP